ncbi:MAG: type IV pilin protein, partial [Burkholderiaceae bacterium]
ARAHLAPIDDDSEVTMSTASQSAGQPRAARGFTLIEVLVVMALIGILTAIALPNYSAYVLRAARAEAQAVMLEGSQFMQRYYAMNNAFDQSLNGTPVALPAALQQSPKDGPARYVITLVNLTPDSFQLQAVPQGPSADDSCGTLTVTGTGVRGVSKSTVADCWK